MLKQALANGDLAHGERLTEAKVARKLKLGRGPARESLLHLEAEGAGRGTMAASIHELALQFQILSDQEV